MKFSAEVLEAGAAARVKLKGPEAADVDIKFGFIEAF